MSICNPRPTVLLLPLPLSCIQLSYVFASSPFSKNPQTGMPWRWFPLLWYFREHSVGRWEVKESQRERESSRLPTPRNIPPEYDNLPVYFLWLIKQSEYLHISVSSLKLPHVLRCCSAAVGWPYIGRASTRFLVQVHTYICMYAIVVGSTMSLFEIWNKRTFINRPFLKRVRNEIHNFFSHIIS